MLMHDDDEPSMPSHTYFNICVVSLIIRGSYAKLIKRGKHFTSTTVSWSRVLNRDYSTVYVSFAMRIVLFGLLYVEITKIYTLFALVLTVDALK